MGDGMRAAIADCYRIFARYDFAGAGDGRLGPLEVRLLRVTPATDVPLSLIEAYCDSLPCGDPSAGDDFRALLPRIMELAGEGDVSPARLREALARIDVSAWAAEETAAVARFLALMPTEDQSSR